MEALCVFPRHLARARSRGVTFLRLGIVLLLVSSGMAQQGQQRGIAGAYAAQSHSSVPTVGLKDLIREAEQNSPGIAVAERGYAAPTHVAPQASALPDTQGTLQPLSVGIPPPCAS